MGKLGMLRLVQRLSNSDFILENIMMEINESKKSKPGD